MIERLALSLSFVLVVAGCGKSNGGGGGGGSAGGGGSGSAGGTSGGGGGAGGGGGGGGGSGATPISAPDQTWTWVPFDDAFCADGSTTGIGVNLSSKSSRVLVYLEGGGACWSEATCYTLMTAVNFNGYGAAELMAEATDASYLAQPGGLFDRSAAANPFKDYSFVYVPYCTGDVHAGNHVMTYGTHTAKHVGFANMTAYLKRLVPTFSGAERVYLAGSSAGGFGALVNWWQAQQAFGAVRVDVIDDSGTPMPADVTALSQDPTLSMTQQVAWSLNTTLPAGCSACGNGLDQLFGFYASAFPTQKGALLSYQNDSVLPQFAEITAAQFTSGLTELTTMELAPHDQLRYFVVGATGHVLWFSPTLMSTSDSVQGWLTKMVSDDASWANESP